MLKTLRFSSLLALSFALAACVIESNDDDDDKGADGKGQHDDGNGNDDGKNPDGEDNPSEGPYGPAARFFLPTGEQVRNTTAPKVEIDAQGGIHAIYPAYAGGDAFYAYCPSNCESEKDVSVVRLETQGTVSNAMLALDANGKPRIVYTLDYNIGLLRCDAASCTGAEAPWDLDVVELSTDLPKDDIFLYPNCTVGAWFLHSPSIALTPSGLPRVGYQARDISGGWTTTDPTKPACTAGTDMTLSRLAILDAP